MKTLAIDFDGTLCKKQSYGNGEIWQVPNEDAMNTMKFLKEKGYELVIFTVRLNPDLKGDIASKLERIEKWLYKHDIPFDYVTNNKPPALAYIDDRAIRFTNWQDISNYFLQ